MKKRTLMIRIKGKTLQIGFDQFIRSPDSVFIADRSHYQLLNWPFGAKSVSQTLNVAHLRNECLDFSKKVIFRAAWAVLIRHTLSDILRLFVVKQCVFFLSKRISTPHRSVYPQGWTKKSTSGFRELHNK